MGNIRYVLHSYTLSVYRLGYRLETTDPIHLGIRESVYDYTGKGFPLASIIGVFVISESNTVKNCGNSAFRTGLNSLRI